MAKEGFTNFATSALTGSITSTASSFSVTSTQGALFPTANFLVDIDTEIILIASRSGDTFTVASGGRGYDGSTKTSHSTSAVVQLSLCAYNLNHVWQNVSDSYHPEVPPVQVGNSPSSYDNEFEAAGSWTLSPSPASGTTFNINTAAFSHLTFNRASGDNTVYTAYQTFNNTGSYTVTFRLSHATSFVGANTSYQSQTNFFIGDPPNPASGSDTGTRIRLDSLCSANTTIDGISNPMRYVRMATDSTGTFGQVGSTIPLSMAYPHYGRLTYDGSGNWAAYVGDGYTFWQIATKSSFGFSPASMGFTFALYPPSQWLGQTVLIDYCRVVLGSMLPPFAN